MQSELWHRRQTSNSVATLILPPQVLPTIQPILSTEFTSTKFPQTNSLIKHVYQRAAKRAPTRPRPRAGLTTEPAPAAGEVVAPAAAEDVPDAVPDGVEEPVAEVFGTTVVIVVLEPTTEEKPEVKADGAGAGAPAGEVATAG